jgi:hypothetical protein
MVWVFGFRLVVCSISSDISTYILVAVSSARGSEGGCDHRVVKEERSIIFEVLLSAFVRNTCSYEYVSNSEWVSRQSCLNLARTILPLRLDFCLWVWMKSEVYKSKVDTRHRLFARVLDAAVCINKREV